MKVKQGLWKYRWTVGMIALMIAVCGYILSYQPVQKKAVQPTRYTVQVKTLPFPGDHSPQIKVYGRVVHPHLATFSAGVSAAVDHVFVKKGSRIHHGQVLVQLDARTIELNLAQAESEKKSLLSKIALQEKALKHDERVLTHDQDLLALEKASVSRYETLRQSEAISVAELDRIKERYSTQSKFLVRQENQLDVQRHQLEQLQHDLTRLTHEIEKIRLDIDRCTLRSPFDGVVTQLRIDHEETVSKGQALLSAMPSDHLEVEGFVPLSVASMWRHTEVKKPLNASVQVDGKTIDLVFDRMMPLVGSGQIGQQAIFSVKRGGNALSLGQHVTFYLDLPKEKKTFVVPESSLYYGRQVYKVVSDQLVGVPIKTVGRRYLLGGENQRIIRSNALMPGDAILINQLPYAINGLLVAVK